MKPTRYLISLLGILLVGAMNGCSSPGQEKPVGRLLYTSTIGSDLYVLNLEDNSKRQISDYAILADFSPDGSKIVYVYGPAEERGMGIMEDDGTELYTLVEHPYTVFFPRWSPDGEKIAYVASGDIYIIDVEGGESKQITTNEYSDLAPEWAPDSKRLAYSRKMFTNRSFSTEVYIWNGDDNSLLRMTNDKTTDDVQSWSPDGRYIVFSSGQGLANYRLRLYILDVESGESWPLIDNEEISSGIRENMAVWSPDGNWIAVSVDGRICIVDPKGVLYDCYTEDYAYSLVDWGP